MPRLSSLTVTCPMRWQSRNWTSSPVTAEAIKNETTEMAVASGYSAIANMDFLAEAMNDDCAGLDFKFDRIKIPSGGMTAFEVPSEDGEGSDLVKEIEAVILYSHPANSYYTEAYKGGSNPPDCGSFDGITGTGTPGGICKNCPFNQFGSGEGKSKACKNRRMLYLLRENEIFPLTLNLPTGSLKGFTKYVQTLLARGKRPNQVVTKISLRKAASASGIDFSQAVFKVVRSLDAAEQKNIDVMADQMKDYASGLTTAAMVEDTPFVDAETGEIIEPLK